MNAMAIISIFVFSVLLYIINYLILSIVKLL